MGGARDLSIELNRRLKTGRITHKELSIELNRWLETGRVTPEEVVEILVTKFGAIGEDAEKELLKALKPQDSKGQ